jgi:choline monooxygenase
MDGSPERDEFALTPIRVETLAGLVFVNMDVSAAGLADQAPDLEESLRSFIPDIDDLLKCHETVHDIRSNWKVMIENSLECYHCEPCHPGFADAVDMDLYRSVSDGLVTIHTSERRLALEKFGDVCAENPRANRFSYWYIWPTTEIDAAPAPRSRLSVFTRRSLAPDRFRLVGHYFRRYDDFPDKAEKQALARNQTLLEDIAICEAVQRGLTSRGYSQGRFIADPERSHFSEHSVHQFQRLVASALGL